MLRTGNHRFELERSKVVEKCEVKVSPLKKYDVACVWSAHIYQPLFPPRLWMSSSPPQAISFPDGVVGENMTQDLKRKILKGNCSQKVDWSYLKFFDVIKSLQKSCKNNTNNSYTHFRFPKYEHFTMLAFPLFLYYFLSLSTHTYTQLFESKFQT